MTETLHCSTHNCSALTQTECWVARNLVQGGYEPKGCVVHSVFVVPADAPSITYRGGFLDIDPADGYEPGVYVYIGEDKP